MITSADQFLAHLVGDFILQSDWMATEKTRRHLAALVHALAYSTPFLLFRPSFTAWAWLVMTHALIDRYRLARYVVWLKNFLGPVDVAALWFRLNPRRCRHPKRRHQFEPVNRLWRCACGAVYNPDYPGVWSDAPTRFTPNPPWASCSATGYPRERPEFMAVWLLIIADNTIHLLVNGLILKFL